MYTMHAGKCLGKMGPAAIIVISSWWYNKINLIIKSKKRFLELFVYATKIDLFISLYINRAYLIYGSILYPFD